LKRFPSAEAELALEQRLLGPRAPWHVGDVAWGLRRHGFTRPGRAIHFNHREVPDGPTPPPLPDGFRYRTVEPEDLAEREEGMRRAVVGCDTDPACALYESIGFRRSWTITSFAR
jgi:hypothetical protein